MQVGHLVKGHRIPQTHQAHLAGRHIEEQVGDGGRAGEEDRIGGQLLIGKGFARAARAEFDQVIVALAKGCQSDEEVQLQSAIKMGGFQTNAADQQVNPFIGGELGPAVPVFIQVKGRHLDRFHGGDPEWATLAARGLIVQVLDLHLCPDTTHQEPIIVTDIRLRDVHVAMAKVGELGPVFVVL